MPIPERPRVSRGRPKPPINLFTKIKHHAKRLYHKHIMGDPFIKEHPEEYD